MTSAINALVSEYDEKWSALDVAGVAALWERDAPQPIYIGDEYAMPLIGANQLDRVGQFRNRGRNRRSRNRLRRKLGHANFQSWRYNQADHGRH